MPSLSRSLHRCRTTVSLIAVLFAPILGGCGRDTVAPQPLAPRAGLGTFDGRWDGAAWHGYGYAVLVADTLFVVGHRPDPRYYYDEYVRARVLFHGVATYAVSAGMASLEQIVGGDAGYFPDAAGELDVTEYDASAARVRGVVQLASVEPSHPWKFEQGAFDVPVYARWQDVPRVRP
jgi:hypothetical protein